MRPPEWSSTLGISASFDSLDHGKSLYERKYSLSLRERARLPAERYGRVPGETNGHECVGSETLNTAAGQDRPPGGCSLSGQSFPRDPEGKGADRRRRNRPRHGSLRVCLSALETSHDRVVAAGSRDLRGRISFLPLFPQPFTKFLHRHIIRVTDIIIHKG